MVYLSKRKVYDNLGIKTFHKFVEVWPLNNIYVDPKVNKQVKNLPANYMNKYGMRINFFPNK